MDSVCIILKSLQLKCTYVHTGFSYLLGLFEIMEIMPKLLQGDLP